MPIGLDLMPENCLVLPHSTCLSLVETTFQPCSRSLFIDPPHLIVTDFCFFGVAAQPASVAKVKQTARNLLSIALQ